MVAQWDGGWPVGVLACYREYGCHRFATNLEDGNGHTHYPLRRCRVLCCQPTTQRKSGATRLGGGTPCWQSRHMSTPPYCRDGRPSCATRRPANSPLRQRRQGAVNAYCNRQGPDRTIASGAVLYCVAKIHTAGTQPRTREALLKATYYSIMAYAVIVVDGYIVGCDGRALLSPKCTASISTAWKYCGPSYRCWPCSER